MSKCKFEVELTSIEGINQLIVKHDGKILEIHDDGGEPEDNSFKRDYNWVVDALIRAYFEDCYLHVPEIEKK